MPLFDLPEKIKHFYHRCDFLPKDEVDIVFSKSGVLNRPSCWTLILTREATEEDIQENSILNEVGESIWTLTHEISHCPYCGDKLEIAGKLLEYIEAEELDENSGNFGEFSLFDQEKWQGRRR